MTSEQIANWKRERDIARAIADPVERERAFTKVYDHRDDMQMECIQHQADRIKTGLTNDAILDRELKALKTDVGEIRKELKPLKESDREFREAKIEARGMKRLLNWLRYIVAAGGGALLLKLLGG